MLPDRVSNPGPLTYESGALPIVLRGPAIATLKMGNSIGKSYCMRISGCVDDVQRVRADGGHTSY